MLLASQLARHMYDWTLNGVYLLSQSFELTLNVKCGSAAVAVAKCQDVEMQHSHLCTNYPKCQNDK